MSQKPFRPSLPTIQSSYYDDASTQQNGGLKERLGGLLGGGSAQLPMYKDKPHYPPPKRKGVDGNKIGFLLLVLIGILWMTGMLPGMDGFDTSSFASSRGRNPALWAARREAVKDAFKLSWDYYAEHAWGMDEFHPVSQRGKNMGCAPGTSPCPPVGWIIVDGLDTAIMMNLTSRVAQAREWISTSLDFGKPNSEMNTFETTIRVLGGLLSAHYLSTNFPELAPQKDDDTGAKGEDLYIEKAVGLANRLLGAYDTPTGIPVSSVNLNTSVGVPSVGDMGAASTAEATTLQLEMKYLAKLTGEPLYWEKAETVIKAVDAHRREGGLVPIYIDPKKGTFSGNLIRLGSRGDSYYEYLIKQYLQTGSREHVYLDMWEEALEGIKKHLITWSDKAKLTILSELQSGIFGPLTHKMDHLVCFLPGTIALGLTGGATVAEAQQKMGAKWGAKQQENLILAEELMKTCWGMYLVTPTGLAPEIAYMQAHEPELRWKFDDPTWSMPRSLPLDPAADASWRADYDIHANDVHNLQRPETVESLFYMWRITGDIKYREWGWRMFQSFTEHTAVYDPDTNRVVGYTSIDSVMLPHNKPKLAHPLSPQFAESVKKPQPKQIFVGNKNSATFRDNMEGFWLAETLKYFYLLFSDEIAPWNDLEKVVINTEAHFFPRFDIGTEGNPWKTGWTRQDRL